MPSRTAIVLAFANDWVDDKRHLRSLLDESKAIVAVLAPLVEAGRLGMPPPIHNATVDEVLGAFRARSYRDRVRIFHFGGHASGSTLLFEDADGKPTTAHASGLASYLGRQRGLAVVFLNGCSTEHQVRLLRDAGVKAVVATTRAIEDEVAAEFAIAFYAEVAMRSLRDAFEAAVSAVRLRRGDDPRAVTRDVARPDESGDSVTPAWPWILDCDSAYETWKLGAEPTGPTWRAGLTLAAAGIALLLATTLVLSAGARRTACRGPGLHALCAAIGIGDLPSAAEQAVWAEALSQIAGDGLRAYLRVYPTGEFVEEARARLAGCRDEREETLGLVRDARFVLAVSQRASPLPTEADARRDALARGSRDADTTCRPLAMTARLIIAFAEPLDWRCSARDGGVVCGFDGEIVCRLQDRIVAVHERCTDDHR